MITWSGMGSAALNAAKGTLPESQEISTAVLGLLWLVCAVTCAVCEEGFDGRTNWW